LCPDLSGLGSEKTINITFESLAFVGESLGLETLSHCHCITENSRKFVEINGSFPAASGSFPAAAARAWAAGPTASGN
jgi:hypothetical protein